MYKEYINSYLHVYVHKYIQIFIHASLWLASALRYVGVQGIEQYSFPLRVPLNRRSQGRKRERHESHRHHAAAVALEESPPDSSSELGCLTLGDSRGSRRCRSNFPKPSRPRACLCSSIRNEKDMIVRNP